MSEIGIIGGQGRGRGRPGRAGDVFNPNTAKFSAQSLSARKSEVARRPQTPKRQAAGLPTNPQRRATCSFKFWNCVQRDLTASLNSFLEHGKTIAIRGDISAGLEVVGV